MDPSITLVCRTPRGLSTAHEGDRWVHVVARLPCRGRRGVRVVGHRDGQAHNKLVAARFDELGNSGGELAELDSLCTPDLVNHALAPGRPPGLEGTREFLRTARRDVFGGRWLSSHVVAENDMVVRFGRRGRLRTAGGPTHICHTLLPYSPRAPLTVKV